MSEEHPQKPVLFLDFDRTLFDLNRFMSYLGYRHEEHVAKFKEFLASDPTLDISGYLYPDTVPFLVEARKTHTIVLLSRGRSYPEYQRKKILGSRVAEYLDDIIITPNDNKGLFAIPFLPAYSTGDTVPKGYAFIDDNIAALSSMAEIAPYVERIYIDRRKKALGVPDGATKMITTFIGFSL
jgi:hypothetical protein